MSNVNRNENGNYVDWLRFYVPPDTKQVMAQELKSA